MFSLLFLLTRWQFIIIKCTAEEECSSHSAPPRKRLKSRDLRAPAVNFVAGTGTRDSKDDDVGSSQFSSGSDDLTNEPRTFATACWQGLFWFQFSRSLLVSHGSPGCLCLLSMYLVVRLDTLISASVYRVCTIITHTFFPENASSYLHARYNRTHEPKFEKSQNSVMAT